MSMFDYLKCKKELPLNDELKQLQIVWSEVQFQTKDLDNCLSNYSITEDGNLVENVVVYEYTYYTEEEKKQKDFRPWNIIKDQKIIKEYTKDVNYHGKITFYEILNFSENEDVWVDFDAYFSYGKLDKIELSKFEKYKCHKIKLEEFHKEQEDKKTKLSYKLKKYSGWFWFWNKFGYACYKLSRFFSNIHMFIIRINQ